MVTTEKVELVVAIHPADYRRLVEAAEMSRIALPEFCALSMHLGVNSALGWVGGASVVGEKE